MLLIKIATGLTFIFSLSLGVFTLVRNPRSKINLTWFLACMAVALWSGAYFILKFITDEETAKIFLYPLYIGTILMPIFFFHFSVKFLLKNSITLYFGYLIALILVILFSLTKVIVDGVEYIDFYGFHGNIQPAVYVMYLYYFSFFIYAFILLYQEYKRNNGIKSEQAKYMLLALVIGVGGGATNFITDVFGSLPYGQILVPLYPIFITYGIFIKKY
ncbi:hypothetical protein C4569_03025 [Candidatus Parcubacteria bacterium]|nr:MAG: hypothetical protein C4569_03025 [Candidatus Parcubacteria bacterium]